MSTHPNVILLLTLTPDGLARKTYRAIVGANADPDDAALEIGGERYNVRVMEDDYDDGFQISAKEGDIIIFDYVTYGYGEKIAWDKLEAQKVALEAWAKEAAERHHCTYTISVTANYW